MPYSHNNLDIGTIASFCCYVRQQILTKGDNNVFDDMTLFPPGQPFVNCEGIVGLGKGFFPCLRWLANGLQENPLLIRIVAGALLLLAVS